ncbi:MAG: hypothetical protein WD425_14450 [Nitrospirales bacterium]
MTSKEKLLSKMRDSKSGWQFKDLDRLYRYFGFKVREGGKHCIYTHPEHPTLMATVTRSRSLAIGYIQHAIKLIDKILEIQQSETGEENENTKT